MNDETITQTVLFPDLLDRPVMATFDQPHASSDGGAVLLKAADQRPAACWPPSRRPPRRARVGARGAGVSDLIAQTWTIAVATRWQSLTDSPTIRSTNCCWGATRSRAAASRRSRRSRGSSAGHPADAAAMSDALADPRAGPPSPPATGRSPDHDRPRCHRRRDFTARSNSPSSMAYDHWCYLPLVASRDL